MLEEKNQSPDGSRNADPAGKRVNRKHELIDIAAGYCGTMLMLIALVRFNSSVLRTIPLIWRMVVGIVSYWSIALVPVIILFLRKEKLSDFGFSRNHIVRQILTGICIAAAFSAIFTVLPHLVGLGALVSSGENYRHLWQFVYEFIYSIAAVGLTEEFLFRGFFFEKISRISNTAAAVIVSSLMFGLMHIFVGSLVQVIMTSLLGVIFCLCRIKIRDCSTLSLGFAHGIYDALIAVFTFVFSG